MADIEIKASLRNGAGKKGELSNVRSKGALPGVVYGGKRKKTILLLIPERALLKAMKSGGANAIIHLTHDKGAETVIVKDLQRDVVTSRLIHVDFQRVDMKKKITVKVPIHTVGEAPGVKLDGGVLEHILREIEVEALPGKIPQALDVDISNLKVGEAIKVKDITAPEGAEILMEADQTVMHVVHATIEEEPEPIVAEGEEGAEPEILKQKKAGEEGEEAEGDAKAEAGKKPEAGKKAEEKK